MKEYKDFLESLEEEKDNRKPNFLFKQGRQKFKEICVEYTTNS